MTVILIIGILAAVAIPGYREYVYNAKLAEGYVGVAAISKAEIIHFNENKFFVATYISPNASACISDRKKAPLAAVINGTWTKIGSPIAPGAENYFSFATSSAQYDQTVSEINNIFSGAASISFVCDDAGTKLFTCDGYDEKIDPEIHAPQAANLSRCIIHGAAYLKGNEPICSLIVQSVTANGTEIRTSPMITFRE